MVLVIDPQIAGIAGDMLLCSLVDMGADVEKIKKCASMGAQIAGTSIRKLEFSKVQKCGISATKLILETDKQHNLHTGKSVADCIAATCKKSNLSEKDSTQSASECWRICLQYYIIWHTRSWTYQIQVLQFPTRSLLDQLYQQYSFFAAYLRSFALEDDNVPISVRAMHAH